MDHCRLLNADVAPAQGNAAMLWIEPFQRCRLGNGYEITFEPETDIDTGHTVPCLRVIARDREMRVAAGTVVNFARSTGIRLVPRAIEEHDGRSARLRVEFEDTDHVA